MTPTEEQIFDYFLGKTTPELSRLISTYLKSHPDVAREIKEWADLEASFKNFPLQSPPELTLNRVRNVARENLAVSGDTGLLAQLKALFTPRAMALSFVLVLVFALSIALRIDQGPDSGTVADNVSSQDSQHLAVLRSENKGAVANTSESGTAENASPALSKEYDIAVAAYQAGDFEQASNKFSSVIAQAPGFTKNKELYTYWIESLKKLGKYDLAEKKQQILEQILSEETKTNGQ